MRGWIARFPSSAICQDPLRLPFVFIVSDLIRRTTKILFCETCLTGVNLWIANHAMCAWTLIYVLFRYWTLLLIHSKLLNSGWSLTGKYFWWKSQGNTWKTVIAHFISIFCQKIYQCNFLLYCWQIRVRKNILSHRKVS